jgi:hypothetical protein
MSEQEKKD